MTTFTEPTRDVPIIEHTDVLIAGAGPAGIMAAVAAARQGVRVRLIEAHGALGGIWTTGCLPHIIEFNKRGLPSELAARLLAAGAGPRDNDPLDHVATDDAPYRCDYDSETFKGVLDQMAAEAGVKVRLYSRVSAAYRDADGCLETIVTDSKSGREAWRARIFVDCTGDGDLAAQAGCSFEMGHPETGDCQPMSMMALLAGAGQFDRPPFNIRQWNQNKDWLLAEMRRGGHDPSYSRPTMFLVRQGVIIMMANHQYGYRRPDAQMLTDATIEGRAENLAVVKALRSLGGDWKNLDLMAQSAQIGVRESRRIQGLYRVSKDDLVRGARFEDAICRVTFCVDIHALNPNTNKGIDSSGITVQPYDIPLRAMIAAEIPNLMMAGRCISGDFYAHASYRVTGDAAAMGEAAGVAAAQAVRKAILPRDLPFSAVRPHIPVPDA